MSDVVWQTSHSIETRASVEFAWRYWSDVKNWDDPPARFEFEGPFVAGASGSTHFPEQPSIQWFVRDIEPNSMATIEIPADGATLSFEWRFKEVGVGITLLTQRVTLRGEKAANYLGYATTFEKNVPLGMKKMASAIEVALAGTAKPQK